ncbi:Uu.00g068110.m01.CDS01 [Anthostomella pinea]|uniref:Uu.00g068110.m01.CDS01 n=1 Tax=Anthostomella pinea TaxID=933095 RepID=A0AAI8VNN6_9PEZI|nr:Uu.00g068110.m01.CDS01 [Anthostomella pinea]
MFRLTIIFPILVAALIALAIYVQVTSSSLSLPLSTGTTVITILLPLIAAANVFYTPILDRILPRGKYPALQQLLPPALQIIQAVLTTIVATLAFEGFLPSQNLNCNLEGNWQQLWHEHDGRGIERIQDSFNCCGLNSVRDRAWPRDHCQDFYNRHSSCAAPWRATMQRNAGLEFGVAVAVGLIQLVHLALSRLRNAQNRRARDFKRITHNPEADSSDRLIEDGQPVEEADGAEGNGGQDGSRRGYGAISDGGSAPRIEPSGLGEERNQWQS